MPAIRSSIVILRLRVFFLAISCDPWHQFVYIRLDVAAKFGGRHLSSVSTAH